MAEEENTGKKVENEHKGSKLLLILMVLVVLLLALVGVGGYTLYSKGAFSQRQANSTAPEAKKVYQKFQAAINDLVLNITDAQGRAKLMKLSFTMQSVDPAFAAVVKTNKPEIIDTVIREISSRSSEELLTVGGKELLKEDLIEDINKVLNNSSGSEQAVKQNSIKEIYFTTFVIK